MLAPRDDDHHLIPIKRRIARILGHDSEWDVDKPGLPSAEKLLVPEEAFMLAASKKPRGIPTGFVLMYWQVWTQRGLSTADIMERFRKYVAKN